MIVIDEDKRAIFPPIPPLSPTLHISRQPQFITDHEERFIVIQFHDPTADWTQAILSLVDAETLLPLWSHVMTVLDRIPYAHTLTFTLQIRQPISRPYRFRLLIENGYILSSDYRSISVCRNQGVWRSRRDARRRLALSRRIRTSQFDSL